MVELPCATDHSAAAFNTGCSLPVTDFGAPTKITLQYLSGTSRKHARVLCQTLQKVSAGCVVVDEDGKSTLHWHSKHASQGRDLLRWPLQAEEHVDLVEWHPRQVSEAGNLHIAHWLSTSCQSRSAQSCPNLASADWQTSSDKCPWYSAVIWRWSMSCCRLVCTSLDKISTDRVSRGPPWRLSILFGIPRISI